VAESHAAVRAKTALAGLMVGTVGIWLPDVFGTA
jgi:hypothetical protein